MGITSSLPVAPSDGAEVIISVVLFALVVFAVLRLTIFLPAIAVDAPGASVRNVFADTGGHTWLIVKLYFITVLPYLLIVISIIGLAWLGGAHDISSGKGSLAAIRDWSATTSYTSMASRGHCSRRLRLSTTRRASS